MALTLRVPTLFESDSQIPQGGPDRLGTFSRILSGVFGLAVRALAYVMGVILLVALRVASKLFFVASLAGVLLGGFVFMMAGAQGWMHDTLMKSFYLLGGGIGCGIVRDICICLFRKIAGYSQN